RRVVGIGRSGSRGGGAPGGTRSAALTKAAVVAIGAGRAVHGDDVVGKCSQAAKCGGCYGSGEKGAQLLTREFGTASHFASPPQALQCATSQGPDLRRRSLGLWATIAAEYEIHNKNSW